MIEPKFKRDPQETWWIHRGRCVEEDPELFFPVGTSAPAMEQTARAVAVCRGCPVRAECLEWSLKTCQDAGVWGGASEEERREMRRARRRLRSSDGDGREDALLGVG